MASESDSGDEETTAVVYTCRRCIGLELSKDELEGHREKHRRMKAEKRARAQRHKNRGGSPAPSTMTTATSDLFITRNVKPRSNKPGPKSWKKAKEEKARQKAAKEKYKRDAAKSNREGINGG